VPSTSHLSDQYEELSRADRGYEELNDIGIALSSTRDLPALLTLILTKAREITNADAASLYVVESNGSDEGLGKAPQKHLRFKLVQNQSRESPFLEFTLPINQDSIVGYSALHGEVLCLEDVYAIPNTYPFRFNSWYDKETGYRTKSLLSVPMKNVRREVIGVMQLINCKRTRGTEWGQPIESDIQPFSSRAVHLANSLASQAAVAYENSLLYKNVENLIDGFVRAAATAIEHRDPATFGHSDRVATMMIHLAEAINHVNYGKYAAVHFTPSEMKLLTYSALLHDFGKIAVPERVLLKAKKLDPDQLALVEQRFEYVRQQLELDLTKKQLDLALAQDPNAISTRCNQIERIYKQKQADLDGDFQFVMHSNETTTMSEPETTHLLEIKQQTYRNSLGWELPLLTDVEFAALSVRRGSLTEQERSEIESHVLHGVSILDEIPWVPELRDIPSIVAAHHEKLNGGGYPFGLSAESIPLASKMMTICDIFDALSAADRPYKKALGMEQSLQILREAVSRNELDDELVDIFVKARIFETATR
jgi:HD-GYP domain-containing protein (c-di-GMP phosphodiesterase class II)